MGMAVATPDLATTPVAQSNGIAIRDPWARQGTNGDNSAAYLVITNATSADTLLSATGDVATSVELHTVVNENGMMQMIPAEGGVPVDANGIQSLKPGSFHIMLIGLRKDLKSGDSFPLTLTFANAGPINVMFEVR
jgi:copper(I)-binding protein